MRFSSLSDWLTWQEGLHPESIELGLERVSQVFKSLHSSVPAIPVITVAGTNGKGSSIALLEAVYQQAGYRTCTYTSPHIIHYNERIRINSHNVSDEQICEAFERIDQARGAISLTYFEFGTLAALDIFYRDKPDIMLLEVGLGGRLDAVNIIDADVALITSIGIDHTSWLGHDKESIAREKAGIMRQSHPAIFSQKEMPVSIRDVAEEVGAELFVNGQDFSWQSNTDGASWNWKSGKTNRMTLPFPNLRGAHQLDNAAGVIMAIECLSDRLPVNQQAIRAGLLDFSLAGRFQCITGTPLHILDVAHNADSMKVLAESLRGFGQGRNLAVLGMLEDKEHAKALSMMLPVIDRWFVTDLDVPRGCSAEYLKSVLEKLQPGVPVMAFEKFQEALSAADAAAQENDNVVIFGSFYTVAMAVA